MLQQGPADALPLVRRQHIGMADQVNIAHWLDTHDPDQRAADFITPGADAGGDLALQLVHRHVRVMPAIVGYDPAIGFGSGIDDRENCGPLVIATKVGYCPLGTAPIKARSFRFAEAGRRPSDYAEFERFNIDYEKRHFRYATRR
jgi:hypothetical protein